MGNGGGRLCEGGTKVTDEGRHRADLQGNGVSGPPTAPGKSCGSCTLCCKLFAIPELKKRAWDTCLHVAPGRGCKIYADRPVACRKFVCGWLLDPNMGPELKPENCHIVFYPRDEKNIAAMCDDDYPGAWRKPIVTEFLHHLARISGPDRKVVVMEKSEIWLVTESAIVLVDKTDARS
jgi:hypothetical protein